MDDNITIKGGGIRAFQQFCGTFADEYKVQFTEGEIVCLAIGPANVAMSETRLSPDATGSYPEAASALESIGINDTALQSAISMARKGRGSDQGDVVTVSPDHDTRVLTISVEREYDTHTTRYETRHRWIDPNSIRKDPEFPDLDLPTAARIDREAFVDGVKYVTNKAEYAKFHDREDGTLVCHGEGDTDDFSAEFEGRGEGNGVSTLVTSDYLSDIVRVLDKTKPEYVRIRLGNEFPVKFITELPEAGVEATMMVAPRIKSD